MFHEQNTVASPAQLCADLGGHRQGHCGKAPCPICQPERRADQNAFSIKAEGIAVRLGVEADSIREMVKIMRRNGVFDTMFHRRAVDA